MMTQKKLFGKFDGEECGIVHIKIFLTGSGRANSNS